VIPTNGSAPPYPSQMPYPQFPTNTNAVYIDQNRLTDKPPAYDNLAFNQNNNQAGNFNVSAQKPPRTF
jgi:hypothetical protein